MQFLLDYEDETGRLADIHSRLDAHFADSRVEYVKLDPVSQLVMSSLGGKTLSENSLGAFTALVRRYRSWSAVRDAPTGQVITCADRVTFAENKIPRIQMTLAILSRRTGRPSLNIPENMSVATAHRELQRLPGVGPKVAAAVLNSSTLQRKSLVVDSHHLRVMKKLGLLVSDKDFAAGYAKLMALLPKDWSAAETDHHHCLVKSLGQTFCRKTQTHCGACPLRDICPSATNNNIYPLHLQPSGRHARLTYADTNLLADLAAMA